MPAGDIAEIHISLPNWFAWASVVLGCLSAVLGTSQLVKTRNAALAAKKATEGLAERVGKIDAVAACAQALALIAEIRRETRREHWPIVLDRYTDLRLRLSEIRGSGVLPIEHLKSLQLVLTQIVTLDKTVEGIAADGDKTYDIAKMNTRLADIQHFVKRSEDGADG